MEAVPEAILFDLDGTLLDTAGDLSAAVNTLLEQTGNPSLPLEVLRPYVSQGGLTLVSIAFDIPRESKKAKRLWRDYLDIYADNLSNTSRLFDGMEKVLHRIEAKGIAWGVVTNKPEVFTVPLLEALGLLHRAGCVVSGDTLIHSKPSPAPIIHGCDILKVSPQRAIMIGDDQRDIVAGRAAGSLTLAAAWGYIQPDDSPNRWGADAILQHPRDINGWIG
jgi:phosphoglycolate phosphatase